MLPQTQATMYTVLSSYVGLRVASTDRLCPYVVTGCSSAMTALCPEIEQALLGRVVAHCTNCDA